MKFLISQNTDGLHRRSGFPITHLAELHGNSNLEICKNKDCGMAYMRDKRVRTAIEAKSHKTGRKCENCGDDLHDTIVNFGENLPSYELNKGFEFGKKADLHLCLGSSLRVTPAADMVGETVEKGGKVVVVNLQPTPYDDVATLRINGYIDDVMERTMKKLEIDIPEFILKRRFLIQKDVTKDEKTITIKGCDEVGKTYTLFKGIVVGLIQKKEKFQSTTDPMICKVKESDIEKGDMKIRLMFNGHYKEPVYEADFKLEDFEVGKPSYFEISYNPKEGQWINMEKFTIDEKKKGFLAAIKEKVFG